MRHKRTLYGMGLLLTAAFAIVTSLWFKKHKPIIPRGHVGDRQFELQDYKVNGVEDGEYEIGVFFVPENRTNPESRAIPVDYVRFPAKEPKGPPVFLLPGGPGNTYIGKTPDVWKAPYINDLRQFSDVVLVNQRGYNPRRRDLIGYWKKSSPGPAWSNEDRVADFKVFAERAVAAYQRTGIDLSGYNVIECAADIADLREILGYQEKIMLMGQSFGSQWCFAVMRNHPEIVERAILSGVEPLGHTYDRPSHVIQAVRRRWAHIDASPDWAPFLPPGGMEEAAEAVLSRLETTGIEVRDRKNQKTAVLLGPDDFPWSAPGRILELFHNQFARWENGRPTDHSYFTLIYPLIDSSLGLTPERKEQLLNDPDRRYVSSNNAAMDSFMATADIWPTLDVGDAFRNPVESPIPVVFLHGDWDVYTPIENTLEIAPYFPNSHFLKVERGGHAPWLQLDNHPEVYAGLLNFAETGSTDDIPEAIRIEPNLGRRGQLPDIDPAGGTR